MTRRTLPALVVVAAVAAAPAADVVILKDGTVLQGTIYKEKEPFRDPATGHTFQIAKGNGFDMLDEGPRVIVFSTHSKQLGEITKDTKIRPEYKGYPNTFSVRKSNYPLPTAGEWKTPFPEFNDKWKRTLDVTVPLGFERVEQQVTYIDPYSVYITSPTHFWRATYRTAEFDPAVVRKLLATHPDLIEADGKPNAVKRVAVARFMLDAGWLPAAKTEADSLTKLFPDGLPADAREEAERVRKDIDTAMAEFVVTEAELALGAGRYDFAGTLLGEFPDKLAEPKQTDRATKLMAECKAAVERHATGRRLLRALLDKLGSGSAPAGAAGGGAVMFAVWPKPAADARTLALVAAAEAVYAEVHPDSVGRIEFFVQMAAQNEREAADGRKPSKTADELLAVAVSGWARGKNGATPDPATALRIWGAREMVLAYQKARDGNARSAVLAAYRKGSTLPLDELAQIVSLLPPAEPDDLASRGGKLLPVGRGVPPGTYERATPREPDSPAVEYSVKLPPEYHHGRAYPVLIVCGHPTIDPGLMIGSLAFEADRHGYILVAPKWGGEFAGKRQWEFKGEDHAFVTAVLRDVVRHYCVDNDRVFLLGAGSGADMAMDIGMSHPDLFAGVIPVGPTNPRWPNLFVNYWQNAQKLPFYIVTGELAQSQFVDLRRLYEKWMPHGFPALMAVYKGRGVEWFAAEPPVVFEWMAHKRRVNGTATLQLGTNRFPWVTQRETDNRFYWLGAGVVNPANLIQNVRPGGAAVPAEMQGDIGAGNVITLRTRGVRSVTVWLGRDMIDWTKPVRVNLNGSAALNWKAKVLEPDIGVLLDEYRERGDRRMLYLARLEFVTPP